MGNPNSFPSCYPLTDNCCTRMGWIEATASNGSVDLHISHHPGVDLDDLFLAFDHDEQEMIRVCGWQMTDYEVIPPKA